MKIFHYLSAGVMVVGLASLGLTLVSLQNTRRHHPEMPLMQSFSAIPRFSNQVEVFGEKYDLSRFDLHERYERELTGMCYTHNMTLLTIKRANRYFPIIEPILKDESVPMDFIYLAAIESSLNPRALSPVKAAGMWQFMGETAKKYGLEVNADIDERYNVEKATRAACKYLRDAYSKFGNWVTVAASYNAGQAGISRRLNDQEQKCALDLLLAEETSRYMFRIMAMKEIMRDPYQYGFVIYSDQLYKPIATHKVKVTTTIDDLTAFAKEHKINYYLLKEFNPWLRSNTLPNKSGRTYQILIPKENELYYDGKGFKVFDKGWIVDV